MGPRNGLDHLEERRTSCPCWDLNAWSSRRILVFIPFTQSLLPDNGGGGGGDDNNNNTNINSLNLGKTILS